MIVVRGNNYQIFAGLGEALWLLLMAEDENINVKELCHFVEQGLCVVSAPGEDVS